MVRWLIYITMYCLTFLHSWAASARIDSIPTQVGIPENILLLLNLEDPGIEPEDEHFMAEAIETLNYLRYNPINLNSANEKQLNKLFFLNAMQINNLLDHIRNHGKLISIYELQVIEGFDTDIIKMMLPFIKVEEEFLPGRFKKENIFKHGKSQYTLNFQHLFEEKKGFSTQSEQAQQDVPAFAGSPLRVISRYRFTLQQDLSLGITAEKDPGEEFFRGSQKRGFDFYSAHFYLANVGIIKTFAAGDYNLQFGQGLALWSGFSSFKGADAISVKKNPLGIRPYFSLDENNFLRGAALKLGDRNLGTTFFYSSKLLDATVIEFDSLSGKSVSFSGFQNTGLHRSRRELENRKQVREVIYGANVSLKTKRLSLGLTACKLQLDAEYKKAQRVYSQFDFAGQSNYNLSIDYGYLKSNYHFFGEFARSQNGGYGMINGFMLSLNQRLSVAAFQRKLSPDYHSLKGASAIENSRIANEQGIYLGIFMSLAPKWKLTAYADHFSFPWMKYRTYMPTSGYDYLIHLQYRPSSTTDFVFRLRLKNKPLNASSDNAIPFAENTIRTNYRLHLSYNVSPDVAFRNRLEISEYQTLHKKQTGYLVYHDIIYRPGMKAVDFCLRYALFHCNDYEARIYTFENDLLQGFSFPSFFGKGSRFYTIIRYRINLNIETGLRLSRSFYTNRFILGSGLDEINANTLTEMHMQLRIRF
jgi:hypothetical protein